MKKHLKEVIKRGQTDISQLSLKQKVKLDSELKKEGYKKITLYQRTLSATK